ncbi:DNA mismatch repair protein [Calycina marina]|uniref:DNA mismatch repair protein n=1 Tax=Calycina marina TaxID=1763456 RepID=A0A9P8CET0_9HELO|nr:DNA mismatch repair protein [Calycina marina]
MSIQALPPEVIAQIKSSTTITSLNIVVYELVKNSLDAGPTRIDVTVDYHRGGCTVEDNGLGILPSEFAETGSLGKLHHTSKLGSNTALHGGTGDFLASLSALSLLVITSHHHAHRSHNTLTKHNSHVVSRQTPATTQQHLTSFNHGTRVTVRDLFGSMPVRVKQRALIGQQPGSFKSDFESLTEIAVALLLSWPAAVALTLKDAGSTKRTMIRSPTNDLRLSLVSKTGSVLSQAGLLRSQECISLVHVVGKAMDFTVTGCISLLPSATKHVQFLAFGIEPLLPAHGETDLHKEINKLFQNSAFGSEDEEDGEMSRRVNDVRFKKDGYTARELKGTKKGVERWPMYYINIQQAGHSSISGRVDIEDVLDRERGNLERLFELLRATIYEFLVANHFRPTGYRNKRATEDMPASAASSVPINFGAAKPVSTLETTKPQQFDHFGTNVKVPSFRRHKAEPESDFDAWSKVKSGSNIQQLTKHFLTNPPEGSATHITRPLSTAPSESTSAIDKPPSIYSKLSASSHTPRAPLISSTGKVTRRPFEDDAIITWMNPETKVQTLVNQRTGLPVPTKKFGNKRLTAISHTPLSTPKESSPSRWITYLLKRWENPVFLQPEEAIPQISLTSIDEQVLHGNHHHCTQHDIDRAFKESSTVLNGRISKASLRNAQLIGQVDRKFILILLTTTDALDNRSLVLIDQHAASERVLVESLFRDLCSTVSAIPVEKPLNFAIPVAEVDLFRSRKAFLNCWGIDFEVKLYSTSKAHIRIQTLPSSIVERCIREPRVLIEMLRAEIHRDSNLLSIPLQSNHNHQPNMEDWLKRIASCPQGIIDMLNSRACRSAIMFNDILTKKQCQTLIGRLASCVFSFQCAHGRPSLVPIVELGASCLGMDLEHKEVRRPFGSTFNTWKAKSE